MRASGAFELATMRVVDYPPMTSSQAPKGSGQSGDGTSARVVFACAAVLSLVLAVALVVLLANGRPSLASGDRSSFAGAEMPSRVPTPAFTLRDQDGALVDSRRLRGELALVTFVYSSCDETCGPQLQLIRAALDDLGRDIPALAISADPRTDTPKRAQRFLLQQYMSGRMQFLLGTEQELAPVYRGFFVQRQTDSTEHHSRIVLLDRRGFQRVGYNLADTRAKDIADDIRLLERER